MSGHTKLIGCTRCTRKYSVSDIREGLFQIETMVCSFCYAEMQAMPYKRCCFGKPSLILPSGKKLLGYNEKALECSEICPDRNICRRVIFGEKENGNTDN